MFRVMCTNYTYSDLYCKMISSHVKPLHFYFFVVELAALRYNIIESRDNGQYHDRPIQTGFRKQIIDLCIDKNGNTSFKDCLSKVPLLVLRAPCL